LVTSKGRIKLLTQLSLAPMVGNEERASER